MSRVEVRVAASRDGGGVARLCSGGRCLFESLRCFTRSKWAGGWVVCAAGVSAPSDRDVSRLFVEVCTGVVGVLVCTYLFASMVEWCLGVNAPPPPQSPHGASCWANLCASMSLPVDLSTVHPPLHLRRDSPYPTDMHGATRQVFVDGTVVSSVVRCVLIPRPRLLFVSTLFAAPRGERPPTPPPS